MALKGINLVRSAWLSGVLCKTSPVQIIDASWFMPGAETTPQEVYNEGRIPGAKFFDLDDCCDKLTSLPHMMPDQDSFLNYLEKIGIELDPGKNIVVYDTIGMFSSPRLWYMLKVSGFPNVAVLEGGLPAWKAEGLEVEVKMPSNTAGKLSPRGPTCPKALPNQFVDKDEVRKASLVELKPDLRRPSYIVDARGASRFDGITPEPREGLRSGHIPNSVNVPFSTVLNEKGFILSKNEVLQKFEQVGIDPETVKLQKQSVIFSCGSGVTACIPLLALVHHFDVDLSLCKVYDGAFAEWGGLDEKNYPVKQNPGE
mmetsp:Transcript_18788/g.24554  ORF Transcript_18788/g.24554 Transcript_18788/m.24554 type:complete len:313 (+) Transcript_18788:519-1457(+)|eukprot:CAMPEP_0184013212 /NCGR_PEP_ID=MMETSP0954-20121128/4881_1 /TAXON_ID=627963 /ORGANISM="Aplanochytrium sp, Strain PBS07" /LENGTH=312 /DNA_ID=CAMNT_0026293363 /DNA_START=456 /DNA_END=1394 /DNA_ORIENTATION=-